MDDGQERMKTRSEEDEERKKMRRREEETVKLKRVWTAIEKRKERRKNQTRRGERERERERKDGNEQRVMEGEERSILGYNLVW